jgi:ribosomal protein S18 acetylase RimI-like enzyme
VEESLRTQSFQARLARPADVEAIFRLKQQLARAEGNEGVLRATARDWVRDGFGPKAQFTALVAESGGRIVGMLTYSPIYLTALAGRVFSIQDLFVDPDQRKAGIGRALLAQLSALAMAQGIPLIQLNVHEENAARQFYDRSGFQHLRECLTYAIGGGAMRDLAAMANIDLRGAPPA